MTKEIKEKVKKANSIANSLDQINDQSNQLFESAILQSERDGRKDLLVWIHLNYGFYFYTYRDYDKSFPHFMYCIKTLESLSPKEVIEPSETYKKLGYYLTTAKDHNQAIFFLKKAEKFASEDNVELSDLKDAIGIVYLDKNDLDSASLYFNQALLWSKKSNNKIREAKVWGNQAEIEFKQKNYTKAIQLLQSDIRVSDSLKEDKNTLYALIKLSKIHLEINDLEAASQVIYRAEKIANSKEYYQSSLYDIMGVILEISRKNEDAQEEFRAYKSLESLRKTLKNLDGEEATIQLGWQLKKEILEYQVQLEQERLENESMKKWVALIVIILLAITIFLLIRSYNIRMKAREKEFDQKLIGLSLEKELSENNLNNAQKSLESISTYLHEKNTQIQQLEEEIVEIKNSNSKFDKKKYVHKLDDLLKSHLMTDENWETFKEVFWEEQPNYSHYLETNFPDLTDSNLRIIYLTKLDLNNAEIARILGITVDAVKKSKQRLRKKYPNQYDTLFEVNS